MKLIALILLLFVCVKLSAQNLDINIVKSVNNKNNRGVAAYQFLTDNVTSVMIATPIVVGIVGLLSEDKKVYQNVSTIAGSIAIAGLSSLVLKRSFDRNRPFEDYPLEVDKLSTGGGSSFPSAHTSAAFSTATSLCLAYPKWYVIAPAMTWATYVGYSRVYLGVHYPSDVLAGAVLGAGSAYLSYYINKQIWKKHVHQSDLSYYNSTGY